VRLYDWKTDGISGFGASGGWSGYTSPSDNPDMTKFNAASGLGNAFSAAVAAMADGPKLKTLVSFFSTGGEEPYGKLIFDAAGDLFGATGTGGPADSDGTVFEIAKIKGGYAGAPTTVVNFDLSDGALPSSGLIADAAGDLLGMTSGGGANGDGTVFEIAKNKGGYADVPTTIVSFTGADGDEPTAGLIADAAGDLFGTTALGGVDNIGTVFEITKTKGRYADAPTTLVSFKGVNGQIPFGPLLADTAGDLFGTTSGGNASDGTVFELAKTKTGYADAVTTLVSFTGPDGSGPVCSLIADAAGDLFGTTDNGGVDDDGVVFEIVKTRHGYASAPTILVSLDDADGANPGGAMLMDAAGNLFGTTFDGGSDNDGTVFEIEKTKVGYANTPTVLVSFKGPNGMQPDGGLIADATGNLFGGTNMGGADGEGTVFEITHSGFIPPAAPVAPATTIVPSPKPSAAMVQAMAGFGASRSGLAIHTIAASRQETHMLLSLSREV
jgi:uncharacterized repeat protein (TIGR03803 family)